jgi:Ricin-type beta-trefoil lectin domain
MLVLLYQHTAFVPLLDFQHDGANQKFKPLEYFWANAPTVIAPPPPPAVKLSATSKCLNVNDNGTLRVFHCVYSSRQLWTFDVASQSISADIDPTKCLRFNPTNGENEVVSAANCNTSQNEQKWYQGLDGGGNPDGTIRCIRSGCCLTWREAQDLMRCLPCDGSSTQIWDTRSDFFG